MSAITCSQCGQTTAASQAYEIDGQINCVGCAEAAVERAKAAGHTVRVSRYVDKTICIRCNTYIGEGTAALESGPMRFCSSCAAVVQDWPYPQWLKLSLFALLLLLVVSLVHGRKYFQAGKNLYHGEQLLESGQYNKALPFLKEALKTAPNSDKGALLTAKAALLVGDLETAQKALQGHNGGHFENADKPEFRDVHDLWNRAINAEKQLEQARNLEDQEGKEFEAATLAHKAAGLYPQFPHIDIALNMFDAGAAFARKDYDSYLGLAEKNWRLMPTSSTAAMLSSALACKYAATDTAAYRQQSEEMLAKAKELADGNKEALESLAEFAPRNQYRLDTREILTKQEYDRKFRVSKSTVK
jgi:hypothetical protein